MENPDTTLVASIIEQPQYHWNNKLVLITGDEKDKESGSESP